MFIFIVLSLLYSGVCAYETPYRVIGLNQDNQIIADCSFSCDESTCYLHAFSASLCLNSSWVALVPSDSRCQFFQRNPYATGNYVVWGVTGDRRVISDTTWRIKQYFNNAVNYGCLLLSQYPQAVWIGLQFENLIP